MPEKATEKPIENLQDKKLPFEGDRQVIVRTRVRARCFAQGCCAPPDFVHYYLYRNPRVNIRSVAFGLGEHDVTADMFDYKRYTCTVHRQQEMDTPTPVECVSRPMHRAKDWPERFLIDEDVAVAGSIEREFLIVYDALNKKLEEQVSDDQSSTQPTTEDSVPVTESTMDGSPAVGDNRGDVEQQGAEETERSAESIGGRELPSAGNDSGGIPSAVVQETVEGKGGDAETDGGGDNG